MVDEANGAVEEAAEAPRPSPKSKLSFKTLILIGLPLVMVQAVLAYFLVSSYVKPRLPEAKPRPEEKKEQEGRESATVEDLSNYVTFPVDDIIVNPAETGGQRYLSVSVNIYVTKELEKIIPSLEPEIRGVIIARISRKRLDELDEFKDQQILRGEIKDDLNEIIKDYFSEKFKDFKVPRVVFTKYTIQ
ncbi:MAG TPA: flagellar basal body-associated FliL family protein [archaeon]|nr:flagellar basal body-associated FliL family protein [archaeon]